MVYVTAWACWKGYHSLKNWSGVISERRLYICVCQRFGSTRERITWICLTQTHTHKTSLFYPWYVISVLFNRRHSYRTGQDIENCGTCRDCACIIYRYVSTDVSSYEREFLHIYRSFYMWAPRAQCVSRCTAMCITLSFWITSVLGVQFYGLVGLSFCSVWQHSRMQYFEYGHSLHKHRCRFDHWTQLWEIY